MTVYNEREAQKRHAWVRENHPQLLGQALCALVREGKLEEASAKLTAIREHTDKDCRVFGEYHAAWLIAMNAPFRRMPLETQIWAVRTLGIKNLLGEQPTARGFITFDMGLPLGLEELAAQAG